MENRAHLRGPGWGAWLRQWPEVKPERREVTGLIAAELPITFGAWKFTRIRPFRWPG